MRRVTACLCACACVVCVNCIVCESGARTPFAAAAITSRTVETKLGEKKKNIIIIIKTQYYNIYGYVITHHGPGRSERPTSLFLFSS